MTSDIEGGQSEQWVNRIHTGECRDVMAEWPKSSIHCCITSPPYWGHRDYGHDDQIGLESSVDSYVESIAGVGDHLSRVLRDDGSWWLNLGDTYLNKSKALIPDRVAIALKDQGWYVRNDAIWRKPNAMPESVTDRLSTTFEHVFHLTQSPEYHYDLDSIREDPITDVQRVDGRDSIEPDTERYPDSPAHRQESSHAGSWEPPQSQTCGTHKNGKNPGDVFEVPSASLSDAHFAIMPQRLVGPMIRATCPDDGVVLDPFAGSGTVCKVAKELGRRWVGIDLSPKYVAMAQGRIGIDVDDPSQLTDDGQDHLGSYAMTDGGSE